MGVLSSAAQGSENELNENMGMPSRKPMHFQNRKKKNLKMLALSIAVILVLGQVLVAVKSLWPYWHFLHDGISKQFQSSSAPTNVVCAAQRINGIPKIRPCAQPSAALKEPSEAVIRLDPVASSLLINRDSPVCRPTFGILNTGNIERIFFAHMRKAGGTTLRSYLKKVAQQHNLTLVVAEAKPLEVPGSRNDTLYITTLRDPVNRAVSQWKYEGRWPCGELIARKKSLFVPTYENSVSLDAWIENDYDQNGTCTFKGRFGWKCSRNCFVRWLNFPHQFCQDVSKSSWEQARHKAYNFNLVIHVDRLFSKNVSDAEEYGHQIERMLSTKGLVGHHKPVYCEAAAKLANQQNPPRLSNQTVARLCKLNQPDYALYNELRDCPNGYQFPLETL